MYLPTLRTSRPGLSLMEVLVAVAIFLLALGGITQLVSMSSDRALEVQMMNQASRLCQSKFAQVQSGEVPLTAQSDTPFDEDPDYLWSLTVDPGTVTNLWVVTVKVARERPGSAPIESSLSQMLLDPSVVGSTQDTVAISGSSPTSGGTAGASTTPATGASAPSGGK